MLAHINRPPIKRETRHLLYFVWRISFSFFNCQSSFIMWRLSIYFCQRFSCIFFLLGTWHKVTFISSLVNYFFLFWMRFSPRGPILFVIRHLQFIALLSNLFFFFFMWTGNCGCDLLKRAGIKIHSSEYRGCNYVHTLTPLKWRNFTDWIRWRPNLCLKLYALGSHRELPAHRILQA